VLQFSKFKVFSIFFVIILGLFFFVPNFISKNLISFEPKRFTLGLDLQGGSYLLLEIDTKPILEQTFQSKIIEIKKKLRKNNIVYSGFKIKKGNLVFNYKSDENKIKSLLNEKDINLLSNGSKEFTVYAEQSQITLEFTKKFFDLIKKNALEQSLEIVRNRIDELGTKEPTIIAQGSDRILVELPGLKDPAYIKSLLGKTAKLTFRFLAVNEKEQFGIDILKSNIDPSRIYKVEKKIIISGENLIDAQPGFDQSNNSSVVNFKLDTFGAKKFGFVTKKNIGRNLAIVIDNEVVSAPVIRDAITTGNGQISGNFTVQEANDLSILLRSGALPAPIKIIEERTVGPDLGKESIQKGFFSLVLGFVLVIIYMIFNYKVFGVFANISLAINLILLIAVLSVFEATLTLPGIAGIILTVGMAVDSNVLIYERIREEKKYENNNMIVFDSAYRRALTTILDANITTFIAAIILYSIGSGPIKGFSITLAIGIITSFFTTFVFGRFLVVLYLKKNKGAESIF